MILTDLPRTNLSFRPVLPAATVSVHRAYASYYTDRQQRFYLRGLTRQGVLFADPSVILIDTDSDSDDDDDDYC